jgi:hypothetical protein
VAHHEEKSNAREVNCQGCFECIRRSGEQRGCDIRLDGQEDHLKHGGFEKKLTEFSENLAEFWVKSH